MALPPIITNSPIYRAITGAQSRPVREQNENASANSTTGSRDSVELSTAALRKLDDDVKSQNTARGTAQDVRTELERNPEISLGLDQNADL